MVQAKFWLVDHQWWTTSGPVVVALAKNTAEWRSGDPVPGLKENFGQPEKVEWRSGGIKHDTRYQTDLWLVVVFSNGDT